MYSYLPVESSGASLPFSSPLKKIHRKYFWSQPEAQRWDYCFRNAIFQRVQVSQLRFLLISVCLDKLSIQHKVLIYRGGFYCPPLLLDNTVLCSSVITVQTKPPERQSLLFHPSFQQLSQVVVAAYRSSGRLKMKAYSPCCLGGFGGMLGYTLDIFQAHVWGLKLLGRLMWRQPAIPAAGCSAESHVMLHSVMRAGELWPLLLHFPGLTVTLLKSWRLNSTSDFLCGSAIGLSIHIGWWLEPLSGRWESWAETSPAWHCLEHGPSQADAACSVWTEVETEQPYLQNPFSAPLAASRCCGHPLGHWLCSSGKRTASLRTLLKAALILDLRWMHLPRKLSVCRNVSPPSCIVAKHKFWSVKVKIYMAETRRENAPPRAWRMQEPVT